MGLLQPESGLLFWMLLSFIVVFVILAKYGFPVITKMVEERRVFVEKSLEAAKEAKAQLDNIKTESEALLQQAREDQMKILNEAAAAKERIISEAKGQAQAEAQKQLEEAKRQIRLEKEAAVRGACSRSKLPATADISAYTCSAHFFSYANSSNALAYRTGIIPVFIRYDCFMSGISSSRRSIIDICAGGYHEDGRGA